ncbi:MAG: FHA domain-containing protein [Clostridiales bacterium]|jgi:hypothetical protein|nr:FHA domain-containing protein [Eubacteriales bacterium]MDH7567225.1 FHA domain-containing protein [Clostridiales bacterium]
MFEIISSLLKYVFITIIYIFIFGIMRLIYLDIRSMSAKNFPKAVSLPYLKLVSLKDHFNFKVEESYLLTEDTTIGRSRGNSIHIEDPFLSGRHAILTKKGGSFYIQDVGSTNGTELNGTRLGTEPVLLKDGDRIHAGQLDFLYVSGERQGEGNAADEKRP